MTIWTKQIQAEANIEAITEQIDRILDQEKDSLVDLDIIKTLIKLWGSKLQLKI